VSDNDDFWSGSHNDPYGNQPSEQSGYFGDAVFDQPRPDPGASYDVDETRRRVLATGPHQLGDEWAEQDDPFSEPFDPNRGRRRREEFSASRGGGGGRGFLAVFLIAALVVALGAAGYAAYSVLQGTDDLEDTVTEASTTTTAELTTTSSTSTTVATPPPGLNIQLTSDQFVCNSQVREFGLITGATPEEEIAFTSPQSPNLRSGQADEFGRLPIRWSCTADQVDTVWELTATGAVSGLSATAVFTGVPEGTVVEEAATTTTTAATTTTTLGEFVVTLTENPFTCDGEARVFGMLTGATPDGQISFTSPQASDITPGPADETGSRPVRWQCTPEQAGTVWELTATDDESGRAITFQLSGQ